MATRPGVTLHRAEALAASLPPLLVAAERVANTVSQGVHGRRRVGPGETFWQFRRTQPGDPASAIDWRQSGKSQHHFVRETEWAAAESVWLWRDASASMNYASARDVPRKLDRAELLTLALAALLVRGGEQVAPLGGLPAHGRGALLRMAAGLAETTNGLPAVLPLPRHARLVLVGDLLSPLEDIAALVERYAAQGVSGHLVQILDPAEEALPFTGRVLFEGPEGEAPVLMNRVETMRDSYCRRLAAHREGLAALASRQRWTFTTHRTDHPPEAALLALFLALGRAAC